MQLPENSVHSWTFNHISSSYILPPEKCTFFLCNCFIYNIAIIAKMMTMMMNNIPPTVPPIAAPVPDELLLLASAAVNKKHHIVLTIKLAG